MREGFIAVFEDMSQMKDIFHFAKSKDITRPINLDSLKKKPGIYMITNKMNKKFYIGMSKNLMARLQMYLNVKVLEKNQSSRINRALLKHGLDKFSVTILEISTIAGTNEYFKTRYATGHSSFSSKEGEDKLSIKLRARENFYMKIFKPQYNIKRYLAIRDEEFMFGKDHTQRFIVEIPSKIKAILDKALDPNFLDYSLFMFEYYKEKRVHKFGAYQIGAYKFVIITPENYIIIDSAG